jgi:hypothetical protein
MSDRHYVHHEDEVALAKILKESKPWIERYGTTLIYGLAAILALAAGIVYFARRPPATAAESQALLLASMSETSTPENYQDVADRAPETPIGNVARLRQAELSFRNAMSNMFSDRKLADEELEKAANTYQRLSERTDLQGDLRERVLAGMARVLETRCDGTEPTRKAAVAAWEKLQTEFPMSKMFSAIAEDRVKKLNMEHTTDFYAWFQQQKPTPGDDLLLPQDGPGQVPDIPRMSLPDFSVPSIAPENKDAAAPSGDASSEESATPDSSPPAEEKPSEETPAPAEETPAADDKAAEEPAAPAAETPESADGTPAPEKSGE